ncbi:MAG TPA: TetR family transcriptional regulator [Acidimicrobiales bacterium]|nr:TetR family transcriptional regulator [Acidimicrobiales bacterium]
MSAAVTRSRSGTRREEQAATTRRAVVDAARRLFAERGYAGTGTTAIVTVAGVGTRGALYHHFEDKEALFAEVFAEVTRELGEEVERRADLHGIDPLEALRRRVVTFLECVTDHPEVRRLLLDGPVVLGWKRFRELESAHGLRSFEAFLHDAAALGIVDQPPRALATLLLAVVDEAAMTVAASERPDAACADMSLACSRLLDGLRIDDRPGGVEAPAQERGRP